MSDLHLLACIGDETIAIAAAAIEAVIDLDCVIPVPFAPAHLHGLAAVRSQIVTVVDTRTIVGLPAAPATGRALLIMVDGHRYALRVDRVDDVRPLPDPVPVDTALLTRGWAAIARGRIGLDDGYALLIDPALLIAPGTATKPASVNADVTIAA